MKAVVTGIGGQDGYFMARKLLGKGWEVFGLSTHIARARESVRDLVELGLEIEEFDYQKAGEIVGILERKQPDVIFNFAAFATGQGMFDRPTEMIRANGVFVIDILEAIRNLTGGRRTILCQASSSEMFGDVTDSPQTEATPLRPKSPYGVAKALAHQMIGIYRSVYGIPCCSAILYNHESVRRSERFVTKKIAKAVAQIKTAGGGVLELGSLEASRDWGYAPEYMEALFRMVEAGGMDDFIVASGRTTSVRDLCEYAFSSVGLDYRAYVKAGAADKRPVESTGLVGCSEKIGQKLGWYANTPVASIMEELVRRELEQLRAS
jgi:GDPmannose 4,6-dehydratase